MVFFFFRWRDVSRFSFVSFVIIFIIIRTQNASCVSRTIFVILRIIRRDLYCSSFTSSLVRVRLIRRGARAERSFRWVTSPVKRLSTFISHRCARLLPRSFANEIRRVFLFLLPSSALTRKFGYALIPAPTCRYSFRLVNSARRWRCSRCLGNCGFLSPSSREASFRESERERERDSLPLRLLTTRSLRITDRIATQLLSWFSGKRNEKQRMLRIVATDVDRISLLVSLRIRRTIHRCGRLITMMVSCLLLSFLC